MFLIINHHHYALVSDSGTYNFISSYFALTFPNKINLI
jgi:hypothetical protein